MASGNVADEDFQLASQPAKIIGNNKRHLATSKSATIFKFQLLDKVNDVTGVLIMLQIDCVFDATPSCHFLTLRWLTLLTCRKSREINKRFYLLLCFLVTAALSICF